VGHREDLLAAARTCLVEQGYANTTARDLVARSGTNLASIGYHFGSKVALLNLALEEAFADYTDKLLVATTVVDQQTDGFRSARETFSTMVDGFAGLQPFFAAFLEALVQAKHDDGLRQELGRIYQRLRSAIAEAFGASADALNGRNPQAVASFVMAICDGLLIQWTLDPDALPPAGEIFDVAGLFVGDGGTAAFDRETRFR